MSSELLSETIPAALAGERLDRVVALVVGCSRSEATGLVACGAVTVDGETAATGKLRLHEGQVVVVDPTRLPEPVGPQPDPSVVVAVVHEDDDIVVIDKPAGLVVHPGAGNDDGTLVNGLLARYPGIAEIGEQHRPGIVHRLDVGTSGLLVVARSERAYVALTAAMASHSVGRVYQTLVWGHPANPIGLIDAPIGRDHRDPMKMAVVVDGKAARTRYRVEHEYRTPTEVAFLECRLETGRTHQIRVHLAAIGHPVVGDAAYGGVRSGVESPRPFLHAAALELTHPVTGEELTFTSPMPSDLVEVMAGLGD